MSVYSIPAGVSFVDALAAQLLIETRANPLTLSDIVILLPTRRACRALREAFLRAADGAALILPRMRPLGEAEEDSLLLAAADDLDLPPAISPLHRQLQLARAVQILGDKRGGQSPTPEQAVRLAGELAALLDQVQIEGLSFDRLAGLVPDALAAHWQVTVTFLDVLTAHWPDLLAEQGRLDPADRRNRLLLAQAAAWQANPPNFPVIAAGSTGSMPAVADLLTVIAALPQGRVLLPGVDPHLTESERAELDETHPQFGLTRLLQRFGMTAAEVPLWPGCAVAPRAWLAGEVMRPAATTARWRELSGRDLSPALDGLARVDCPGLREEAQVVALAMRQALETPGRTAALVTPDRGLARRVAAELSRYDIEIDDSAGQPLTSTPIGAFLLLTATMVAEDFAPHATLAALKHPLAAAGMAPDAFRTVVRRLERVLLRGPRPAPGLSGLQAALAAAGREQPVDDIVVGLSRLAAAAAPLEALFRAGSVDLGASLDGHLQLVEALAEDGGQSGAERLWRGEAGQAAQKFFVELQEAAGLLPPFAGPLYPGLLRGLIEGIAVRPRFGRHPRLFIWGPLEARMQHVDLLILGGLNDGVWPPEPATDPWMSRPMRRDFGLPSPERRIGLSAHDFVQAFCAPEVLLTRATRAEGAPTVPSRWLQRLDTVLRACGHDRPVEPGCWLGWAAQLDRPSATVVPKAPAPCPPFEARPRRLSATAIETWMRDPYAIYAGRILGLTALDPIDADPGAADYGTTIHAALHAFIERFPRGPLPADAAGHLRAIGEKLFADLTVRPGLLAFWWPRFERIAAWFIATEAARRSDLGEAYGEIDGLMDIPVPSGSFRLTARADRIDRLAGGGLAIIDYKTGTPPRATEVAAGYAPQMPLEAAIAAAGGFPGLPAAPVERLEFWRLNGNGDGGRIVPAGDDVAALAQSAYEGLVRLITIFDQPETPYRARPHPDHAPRYSDYGHLARVKEWSAGSDGESDS